MRLRWEIFDAYKISVIDMPNLKSPLNIFLHVPSPLTKSPESIKRISLVATPYATRPFILIDQGWKCK